MKLRLFPFLLLAFLASCTSNKPDNTDVTITDTHNSANSIDWEGTYTGVIPCADCQGIQTKVILSNAGKYMRQVVYLGKSPDMHSDAGTFTWDEKGGIIILQEDSENGPRRYKVGVNKLIHLDQSGNPITGDLADKYILVKSVNDMSLAGPQWKLVQLNGREINSDTLAKEAFISFSEDKQVSGNTSCNNFFGTYHITSGLRFGVYNLAMTEMACLKGSVESEFVEALKRADNYSLSGDRLTLNKAKMAPLMVFSR